MVCFVLLFSFKVFKMIVTVLPPSLRKNLIVITESQLEALRKTNSVNLALATESSSDDSPLVTAIKQQLAISQQENVKQLGLIGAELIESTSKLNESLVQKARALRKEADELLSKARSLHNSQQHLLVTGDVLPLASALCLTVNDQALLDKHVKDTKVPDYFAQQNKKEK